MKYVSVMAVLFGLSLFASFAAQEDSVAAPLEGEREKEIRKLRVKRRDELLEFEKNMKKQAAAGRVAGIDILHVQVHRLRADLDLTESVPERIALLESILKVQRQLSSSARLRMRAGRSGNGETAAGIVAVSDVEIELARERMKAR
ncbi:MAG: hypothetical protein AAF517_16415 [Planctomycetota bacterium]